MIDSLQVYLRERAAQHLYRTRQPLDSPQQVQVKRSGQTYLSFCSNDYLGLCNHPDLVQALQQGVARYGVGSGASQLVTGYSQAHQQLEERIAAFFHRPRALLFSNGYMANLGVISSLCDHRSAVFADRLVHASLIDGARLSHAKLHRYAHLDTQALQQSLHTSQARTKLIASDALFSMDGDVAALAPLANLAHHYNAWLMIDDAHGIGVLGAHGRGSLEQQAINSAQVPILVGTLGKALGGFGAFVTGEQALIETLIQKARSLIYTTAPPPALAHASCRAFDIIEQEPWRREHLHQLVQSFRSQALAMGLPLMASNTPIQPLLVGSSETCINISEQLYAQHLLVTPIRPPTVAQGKARLRITFSANHTQDDVQRLLTALNDIIPLLPESAAAP